VEVELRTAAEATADKPPRSPKGTIRVHGGAVLVNKKVSELKRKPSKVAANEPIQEVDTTKPTWHVMSNAEFCNALEIPDSVLEVGLTSEQAKQRQVKYGLNLLTPPATISALQRFLKNLFAPFSLIMQGAGVLCFIIVGINSINFLDVQTLSLAIVLFGVAILTSAFQTSREMVADNLMDALHALTAENAWVYRDGKLVFLDAAQIVPGDLLKIQQGEKVPADLRIMEADELKVNNAPLTGEDADITLKPVPMHHLLYEAKNLAWSGCNFTMGTGKGMVFQIGDRTRFGEIASAATEEVPPETTMRREVKRLVLVMSFLGTVISISFLCAALGKGQSWQAAIIIMIGLFVANIPEGLLPQITIALTITAKRMVDRQVVVSSLEIIETLGAVSVICSDKTGTLTMNQMTVSHIMFDNAVHITPTTPLLANDDFEQFTRGGSKSTEILLRTMSACSDAFFLSKDDGGSGKGCMKWPVKGDASETGFIRFVQQQVDLEQVRSENPRLTVIPFHSSRKWMATVNGTNSPTVHNVHLKGAAERVLARCTWILIDGQEHALTPDMVDDCTLVIKELASRGERVLGFATTQITNPADFKYQAEGEDANFPLKKLTLVGFVSLSDPPRPSVRPAIDACRVAGIQVIMVTGDHPDTAQAIARSLGLITLPNVGTDPDPKKCSAVVEGSEIPKMSQADWDLVLSCGECVFARTQPEQKQELVHQLQRKKLVVAMTGDGVNDAPALKAANVGVAMGSGTSVAKEAAQLTILDDDFGSIVVGIREGRTIFENLKKSVVYITTHLSAEIVPYVFAFAFGLPLAMETIVIMLVDLGTDMMPGIAIAYEEPERRVMSLPPRALDAHMIAPRMLVMGYFFIGMLQTFFCYYAFVFVFYEYGYNLDMITFLPPTYRDSYKDLSMADQKDFTNMCRKNTWYTGRNPIHTNVNGTIIKSLPCDSPQGMSDFMDSFTTTLGKAQAAYFMTLSIMQFAHVVVRRQQTMSTFDPTQVINWQMIGAIAFSACFAVFFAYVPTVNNAFFMSAPSPAACSSAVWGAAVIILLDELRKWFCRNWPDGYVARWTLY
jgi:sodium/potassium-transporting ATPase subunit alpha